MTGDNFNPAGRSEDHSRRPIESDTQAAWETDAAGVAVADSPSWRDYTGQTVEQWIGHGWVNAVHPDDRGDAQRFWRASVAAFRPVNAEFRLYHAAIGSYRWANLRAQPVIGADGSVRKWIGMNVDIHDRKIREDALQEAEQRLALANTALAREQSLLSELQHRSRNTLAVIRSLVRRTAETSQTMDDFARHLEDRIGALSRVQVALSRDQLAGFDLAELVSDELRTYAAHEGRQFVLDGPPVRLKPKAAETMGLAIHELAINAVKHGAFAVTRGRIEVQWRKVAKAGETWIALDWTESGMTGHLVAETRRGFGAMLLDETLRHDLGAEVKRMFEPGGFRCEIALPFAANAS